MRARLQTFQIDALISPSDWLLEPSWNRFVVIVGELERSTIGKDFWKVSGRVGFSDFTLNLRINRIIGWRIFRPVVSSSVVLSQHLSRHDLCPSRSAWWSWSAPIIFRHPIQAESAYYYEESSEVSIDQTFIFPFKDINTTNGF